MILIFPLTTCLKLGENDSVELQRFNSEAHHSCLLRVSFWHGERGVILNDIGFGRGFYGHEAELLDVGET